MMASFAAPLVSPSPRVAFDWVRMQEGAAAASSWGIKEISPGGALTQRIEGKTRKTWKFTDVSKDRVQVELASEGRPIHADLQLWLGPNYTPFTMKAYSEDGKARPIHTLIGTRNKAATVEVRNIAEQEFPFSAASNYAVGAMEALPRELPATTDGERVDGGALRSYPIDPATNRLEVILKTDKRQLKARIELLNGPNNPKQTYEVYTSSGEVNQLAVCFEVPDAGNTFRILNLSPVEFPCDVHLREM